MSTATPTPIERVVTYLDAIDTHNALSSAQYSDVVHGLNFDVLLRSDLRAIVEEREPLAGWERVVAAKIEAERDAFLADRDATAAENATLLAENLAATAALDRIRAEAARASHTGLAWSALQAITGHLDDAGVDK